MRLGYFHFLALIGLTSSAWAIPTGSAFNFVPSRFSTTDLTAGSRGLGELCYARDRMPDGSVCNPALLGDFDDSLLLGRIFFGNGYTALSTANQLVLEPITADVLQKLFKDDNVTTVEAHAGLLFQSRYFGAGFSPYRVQYVSEVHNPNLPVISVHTALERSMYVEGGIPLKLFTPALSDFLLGTRVSFVQRKYVHSSFSLFQALSDAASTFIPLKEQTAVLMDTVMTWAPSKMKWKPQFTLGLKNLGWTSVTDALYPESLDLVGGVGIRPPVGKGVARLGVDFVSLVHGDSLMSRLRFGASYQYGIAEALFGANERSLTTGFQLCFQFLEVAAVYEFIRSDFSDTGYLAPENRVSTEFAVRL